MLRRRGCLGAAVALAMLPGIAMAQDGMVILAAASLKNVLDEISADWSRASGKPAPKISYAASSALAKQIEQGAPADLCLFDPDAAWVIEAGALPGRSQNTPFDGRPVEGRVLGTWKGGRRVFGGGA